MNTEECEVRHEVGCAGHPSFTRSRATDGYRLRTLVYWALRPRVSFGVFSFEARPIGCTKGDQKVTYATGNGEKGYQTMGRATELLFLLTSMATDPILSLPFPFQSSGSELTVPVKSVNFPSSDLTPRKASRLQIQSVHLLPSTRLLVHDHRKIVKNDRGVR
ncbi:hypothetical protein BDM02DRAFT_1774347 [Thelephora ganbajun]|uniref:Uncharacterized protein n=1 Tax=Thelephora ganbajun TaxID=370292 RepID=A0ACB6Z0Q8_THEGA|nr:hypothetical protein BDM02DRAFT_1774347 [Thelephora ganbajun]